MMKHIIDWFFFALISVLMAACSPSQEGTNIDMLPPIYPDYTDVTIPYNIAPMNFLLRNNPSVVDVSVSGKTTSLHVTGRHQVRFPIRKWKIMLESECGNLLTVTVSAKINGRWFHYRPFGWTVSGQAIDPYLTYRLIEPGYEVWNKIRICERDIENFKVKVLADNEQTDGSCMNCHIFGNQDPQLSFFHLRGAGGGTILNRDGRLRKLNLKAEGMNTGAVYGAFHPSGRFAVFSSNNIIPELHAAGSRRLEVYDESSSMILVDFDRNEIIPFNPPLSPRDEVTKRTTANAPFRTFPVFSADGRYIIYCDAPWVKLPEEVKQLKYSICRVPFDVATITAGNQVDTLFSAARSGQSACHPKVSPDGRYLMFTVADCGTFPIWHREADLYTLDMKSGKPVDMSLANAFCSDTYHSWSQNSRWFVFASKRDDGIYGKPYFSLIDGGGKASKPFLLPQRDPSFYDYTLKSFNIPELSSGPVPFGAYTIEKIYRKVKAENFHLRKP